MMMNNLYHQPMSKHFKRFEASLIIYNFGYAEIENSGSIAAHKALGFKEF